MSDVDSRIQAATDSFVRDLSELLRSAALASVSEAFGEAPSRAGRRRGSSGAFAHARRKGQKRTPAELEKLQERLLAAVTSNPGARMEQLGASIHARTKDLMLVTRKLLAAKAIRKRGVKRATKYYPAA